MSSTMNKIKDALHINDDNRLATGKTGINNQQSTNTHNPTHSSTHNPTHEGSFGPHESRLANSADPRVDSDLDSSRYGNTLASNDHNNHTRAGTGANYQSGAGLGHSSAHIPRAGDEIISGQSTRSQHSRIPHSNFNEAHDNTYGGTRASNTASHDSNLLNKLDPRVESDSSGHRNTHGRNPGGAYNTSGGYSTSDSGTAHNTTGPYKSDLANKLDPRVDSDYSQTPNYSGNRNY